MANTFQKFQLKRDSNSLPPFALQLFAIVFRPNTHTYTITSESSAKTLAIDRLWVSPGVEQVVCCWLWANGAAFCAPGVIKLKPQRVIRKQGEARASVRKKKKIRKYTHTHTQRARAGGRKQSAGVGRKMITCQCKFIYGCQSKS